MNRLLRGATLAVDGGAGNTLGEQLAGQHDTAAKVGALGSNLRDTAKDDVVDLCAVDLGAADELVDHLGTKVGRVPLGELSVATTSGSAHGLDNVCSVWHSLLWKGAGANSNASRAGGGAPSEGKALVPFEVTSILVTAVTIFPSLNYSPVHYMLCLDVLPISSSSSSTSLGMARVRLTGPVSFTRMLSSTRIPIPWYSSGTSGMAGM